MELREKTFSGAISASSGPLRLYHSEGNLFVTGFGLRIPVASEEEGLRLIEELEESGYKICY
jgi:hypothetical protein